MEQPDTQKASNAERSASPPRYTQANNRKSRSESPADSPPQRRKSSDFEDQKQERRRSPSSPQRGQARAGDTLYVGNLNRTATDRDLEDAFGSYGSVLSASVVYDPATRESRGFGFVSYKTVREADAAIDGLHRTKLLGRELIVERSNRKHAHNPTPGRYLGYKPRDERNNDRRRGRDRSDSLDDRCGRRRDSPRDRRRRSRSRERFGNHRERERRSRDRYERNDRFARKRSGSRQDSRERRRRRSDSREKRRKRSRSGQKQGRN